MTRIYLAAALSIALFASGWYLGGIKARGDAAASERDHAAKKLDEILDAQKAEQKRSEKLQRTLDKLPKSEGAIRETVSDNPAGCERPAAVAKRVQQAIREANASREMPANP